MFLHSFWCGFSIGIGLLILGRTSFTHNLPKRYYAPESNLDAFLNTGNPLQNNYDEYPMIVPKRGTKPVNQLIHGLPNGLRPSDRYLGGKKIHAIDDQFNKNKIPSHKGKIYEYSKYLSNDETKDDYIRQMNLNHVGSGPNYLSDEYDNYPDLMADIGTKGLRSTSRSFGEGGLQRRSQNTENVGSNKGKVYWRCYFNAVTCF